VSEEKPSSSSWVPTPPDAEGEGNEQPTSEVSAVPVTPPPAGVSDEPAPIGADEPAPVAEPAEPEPKAEEPEATAEPAVETEPVSAPETESDGVPEPVTEPEPAAIPDPAVVPEIVPEPVIASAPAPTPHAHPLSPEPATAGPVSWQQPAQTNSTPASSSSGSGRPELVLAAGFAAGLVLAQVVKRLAK
jgi:hypothetical protein